MSSTAKLMALVVTAIVVLCTASVVSDISEADAATVNLDSNDSLDLAITDTSYDSSSDVVLVLSEGTYNYSTTSYNAFHGRSLTILAAEDADVTIVLSGTADGSTNIAALSTATEDVETSLYVDGVTFTAPSGEAGQLRKWTFDNVTFKDCRFENTSLDTITAGPNDHSYEGTFVIVGCVFETTVGSHQSNPFAIHVMANDILLRDTTVSGYERGINIGLHGDDIGSVTVTGCTVTDLKGTNSKHIALQVGDSIGDAMIAVTDNTISAQYGLSIHDAATVGTNAAINVVSNTFTDCYADVFYAGEVTNNYGIAINLLDNSFVHGDATSDSPTLGNEPGTQVPADQVEIADVSDSMGWYTPGTEMTITTADELRQFAALVNSGIDFDGETVILGENITLTGEWTPIGQGTRDGSGYTANSIPFMGTFDGNGHSISGLEIKTTEGADCALGLFGIVAGGIVKDLTLLDVDIDCSASEMAGAVAGMLCEGGTVSGCTVGAESDDASKVSAGRGNGGIVGRMTLSGTIEDCTNYAAITGTSASGNTGGIVGAAYYANEGMTISGCHNYGSVSATMGVGGIVGLTSATIADCHNHGEVTGNGTSIGGIAGEARGGTVIESCTNEGAVSNGSTSTAKEGGYGTGGIIGWIRYIDPSNYGDNTAVSVSGSTNSGAVTSSSVGAGGIVGMLYHSATVDGNTSTEDVSGNGMVGGIVGGVQSTDDCHSGSTCHIRITDNKSSGKLTNSGSNTGSIVGHLTTLGSEIDCTLLHGSYVTNYGNTSTATGADTDGFQQVGMLFSTVIDGVTYGYRDLGSALANCPDNGTILVLDDCTSNSATLDRDIAITIDLGSHTVTMEKDNGLVIRQGDITIIGDGELTQTVEADSNSGTIVLYGSESQTNETYTHLTIAEDATVSGYLPVYVPANAGSGIVADIHGTIEVNPEARIVGNGVYVHGTNTQVNGCPTINLNDGSVITCGRTNGAGNNGVYIAGYATLNVYDATITADVGIEQRSGVLNVYGDPVITSNGTVASYHDNINGTTSSGVAVSIVSYSTAPSITVNIQGGTFSAPVALYVNNDDDNNSFDVTVSGGNFSVSDGATAGDGISGPAAVSSSNSVTDGFIIGGTFSSDVSEFCIEGYTAQKNSDDTYGIDVRGDAVAKNSTTGQQYASLADALQYANDGDTIVLLSDVSETVTFDRDIKLTLNLGEFTLSTGSGCPLTVTAGALTIDASTGGITGTRAAVMIDSGATVGIMGGKLTSNGYTVQIRGDGSRMEIGGSTSITGPAGVAIYGGSLSMTGGSLDATVYGIAGNGSSDGTTIVISGGDITSDGNAIYHPQEGDITISGGNISGITGLWYSGAGKITVSGGTISSFDEEDRTDPWKPAEQDDGTSYDGAALSIVTRGTGYQDSGKTIEVAITGGTFESAANYALRDYRFAKSGGEWQTNGDSGIGDSALASISISGNARFISPAGHPVLDVDPASSERYSITGGSFTSDVSAYLADGHILVSNPDGTYGVAPDGNTVTVTFVVDGTSTQVTIPKGGTVPSEFVPDLPVAPEYYEYIWDGDVGSVFYDDATITAKLIIRDLEVSVDIDGDFATAVIETPVDYVNVTYSWFYGVDGDDPDMFGSTGTVTLGDDGRYGLLVIIEDADGVNGLATCEFDYVAEPDLPPVPFPGDDDDYVPIPPIIVQEDSGDDDTKTVAACAAAAVAAAILAILLASLYRRR